MARLPDVHPDAEGWHKHPDGFGPGDYWKVVYSDHDDWFACVPTGWMGNLSSHEVTEHEDGTITVSPSILVTEGAAERRQWHGYLEHGVWREV